MKRKIKLTIQGEAKKNFKWLKNKTSAETDVDIIRTAMSVYYALVKFKTDGYSVLVRKNNDEKLIVFPDEDYIETSATAKIIESCLNEKMGSFEGLKHVCGLPKGHEGEHKCGVSFNYVKCTHHWN